VALTARARSTTGTIMATITNGLALAGPLLAEGVVCLLLTSPLFYLVGGTIGLIIDSAGNRGPGAMGALLAVPFLFSMEGAAADLPRGNEVTVTRTASTPVDLERSLAASPSFGPIDSRLLKLKFPKPLRSEGSGLEIGATRLITFTPRKSLGIGARAEARSMTLKVVRSSAGAVVFEVVQDSTLARWLDLQEAEFRWSGRRLSVTLRYQRTFDPAWYFGPVQRYAVAEAADYLAETFAP
jgi:hypothetical protein